MASTGSSWSARRRTNDLAVRRMVAQPAVVRRAEQDPGALGAGGRDPAGRRSRPRAARRVLCGRRQGALPGLRRLGPRAGHDALYEETTARRLLVAIQNATTIGALRFVPEPHAQLPVDAPARVVDTEQSNTSVVFDSVAIMKVFRRVIPGINPDLELNRVLGRAGCPYVAKLLGAVESSQDGQPVALAMVTAFAENSANGWAMASVSARDLFAEVDLHADEVGGDFAGESFRLGEAVAVVHRTLAKELGTSRGFPPVEWMSARLAGAVEAVPELVPYAPFAAAAFGEVAHHEVTVQRVHGDLHLGQVLRTPDAWLPIPLRSIRRIVEDQAWTS